MKKTELNETCPCGRALAYDACCGRYIEGPAVAPTAEDLMRSRYTAYVRCNEPYLMATWAAETRPDGLDLDEEPVKWLGLEIVRCERGQPGDQEGMVSFVARYKVDGRAYRLVEESRFVLRDGQWLYLDGELD